MKTNWTLIRGWMRRSVVFLPFAVLIGVVLLLEMASLLIAGDSEAVFVEQTPRDSGTPTRQDNMRLTIPEAESLPFGLEISTHDFQPKYRERAIFVGDDALVVEVRLFTPIGANLADEPDFEHVVEASFGPVYWLAVPPGDGPRAAKWIGNSYGYSVSVLSVASWDESNLVEFAEALVKAQR